jgi:hypothetical protein
VKRNVYAFLKEVAFKRKRAVKKGL